MNVVLPRVTPVTRYVELAVILGLNTFLIDCRKDDGIYEIWMR